MKRSKKFREVETHYIKRKTKYFPIIKDYMHRSKNLYNAANFKVRHFFFDKEAKFLGYTALYHEMKDSVDYENMPSARSAQQTLRSLEANWSSYFEAMKAYKKNPENFTGKPRIPGYKEKDGYYTLILTNQDVRKKDGILYFPETFDGFTIKTNAEKIQQVRFCYDGYRIYAEIIYEVEKVECCEDSKKIVGIDIGVNNLATLNDGEGGGCIINGRTLKSINQYYNKETAKRKSVLKKVNNQDSSKAILRLACQRGLKIWDYMHKASRKIVDFCVENGVDTIVIGHNDGWKQKCRLSKRINQNFVQIPFNMLIEQIIYKARRYGIKVIITEESYTSGTSFLDGEQPTEEYYKKSRRIKRGLFKTNTGLLVNSDWNGAGQIIRKIFPNINCDKIPTLPKYTCK